MSRRMKLALGTAALAAATASIAVAQNAPPTYQADPKVYKLIFEDQNFRVILGTWKPGAKDKPHSHPLPSVTYLLTDCASRLYNADGTVREASRNSGAVITTPLVTSWHSAENIGPAECKELFVERK